MTQATRLSGRELRQSLRERFGFRRFRPGQAQAVQTAMDGRDTIVIVPTGSGKSPCFQLPALALEGTTIVVSPLIALMKDQTEALSERGIEVTTIHSMLSARAEHETIAVGRKEFVSTTPERAPEECSESSGLHAAKRHGTLRPSADTPPGAAAFQGADHRGARPVAHVAFALRTPPDAERHRAPELVVAWDPSVG
jgi:hypothetical protein